MEESANDAIYIGVYVLIFIAALSITIFLFTNIVTYAEKSYEYGQNVTGSTISGNAGTTYNINAKNQVLLTSDEVMSYYYNYIKKDQYSDTSTTNTDYHVTIYYTVNNTTNKYETGGMMSNSNTDVINNIKCSDNEKYILEYIKEENGTTAGTTIKYIQIKKVKLS